MDFAILDITTPLGFGLRLLVAIVLGLIIGLERQWTNHQAGILTNVIVCVGAFAYSGFSYLVNPETSDVTRIASNVVTGIGFLGAGVILRDGTNIRGLNTAATVWASGAVGILCCVDNLLYAVIVAVSIVIMHLLLHPLSSFVNKKRKPRHSKHRDKAREHERMKEKELEIDSNEL